MVICKYWIGCILAIVLGIVSCVAIGIGYYFLPWILKLSILIMEWVVVGYVSLPPNRWLINNIAFVSNYLKQLNKLYFNNRLKNYLHCYVKIGVNGSLIGMTTYCLWLNNQYLAIMGCFGGIIIMLNLLWLVEYKI